MTRRPPLLLAGLGLLLALTLGALWFAPGPVAQWRAWRAPEPQPPNLDDVRAALLVANPAAAADYPAVLERPLLLPSRRAVASASDPIEAAAPQAIEQVTFTGIVSGPTLAGVLLEENGQARFLRRGEAIGDWTLESIDGRTLSFKRGDESKSIDLPYADQSAATGGNAPTAAPNARAPRPPRR
jgi:hypothetical protein